MLPRLVTMGRYCLSFDYGRILRGLAGFLLACSAQGDGGKERETLRRAFRCRLPGPLETRSLLKRGEAEGRGGHD